MERKLKTSSKIIVTFDNQVKCINTITLSFSMSTNNILINDINNSTDSAPSQQFINNSNVDYTRPNMAAKSWPIGEDVVISGIGGRFPEADNIDELAANLLAGVDMVTRDDRRWPVGK